MGIQEISFIPKTYDLCCSMNVKGRYVKNHRGTDPDNINTSSFLIINQIKNCNEFARIANITTE